MIQVQRFNKVLKLAVILGDLVILNVLFISFNSIWNELFGERAYSGTLPQILTLFRAHPINQGENSLIL